MKTLILRHHVDDPSTVYKSVHGGWEMQDTGIELCIPATYKSYSVTSANEGSLSHPRNFLYHCFILKSK